MGKFVNGAIRSDDTPRTQVAASASSVQLLPANPDRLGVIIVNDSTDETLYVGFGDPVTLTDWSINLFPGDLYESPGDMIVTCPIHGIWTAASGAARITELV